ncbi:MAG: UvrD-helicase domain-containing protein [Bacteroidia bacterium]|nr:UvrD-helicase domain-containing protein [Bacteroidia bacterium]
MAFSVYRSSAGSGKTFTLVKEYLKLCLRGMEQGDASTFRGILAITFTNKATAEMKNRVISSLEGLSSWPWNSKVQAMGEVLSAELQLSPSIITERSLRIFRTILHQYEDFSIQTIDKFTSKVIRSFARDLGLSQDFEVELDSEKVLTQAITKVLDEVANNEVLKIALTEFALDKLEGESSYKIFDNLFSFAKEQLKEESYLQLDNYRDYSISALLDKKVEFKQKVVELENKGKNIGVDMLAILDKSGVLLIDFKNGNSGFGVHWKKLVNGEFKKPNSHVEKAVENGEWFAKDKSHLQSQLDPYLNDITLVYKRYLDFIETDYPTLILYKNILKTFNSLVVINEIEKAFQEIKETLNVVLISEFNLKISAIVSTEPAPFVYEKIGQRYRSFLIDEFQDTSVMQWLNLLPLIDESLSNGNYNLLVGDAKQAIYRFRGGEVEQFAKLPAIYLSPGLLARQLSTDENKRFFQLKAIREARLNDNFELFNLSVNRRSKREIIEFNNAFYSFLCQHLSPRNQSIFTDYEQGFEPSNTGGMVQLQTWQTSKEDEVDGYQVNWDWTLQTIQQAVQDGYSYSDITILTTKNRFGAYLAEQLLKEGIQVLSAESLLIVSSPNVKLLIALAGAIAYPSDTLSLATASKYLSAQLNLDLDSLLSKVKKQGLQPLLDLKSNPPSRSYLLGLPLHDLFLELANFWLTQMDINTQFLLDEALNYSKRYGDNLMAFLSYFEENKNNLKVKSAQASNSITVMSIHKSKGLEFPVVIIPFIQFESSKGFLFWYDSPNLPIPNVLLTSSSHLAGTDAGMLYDLQKDKAILDKANLLYVATTRPRERLYLFQKLHPKANDNPFLQLSDFAISSGAQIAEGLYRWGQPVQPSKPSRETLSENPVYQTKLTTSANWRQNLLVKADLNKNQSSPSRRAIQYGVLVHEAMSYIKTKEDVESASMKLVQNQRLADSDLAEFIHYLQQLVAHSDLQKYFSPEWEVLNEQEILLPNGKTLRPDRVLVADGKAVIIDFKTGLPSPKHQKQLKEYGESLSDMGLKVSELLLYYTANSEVVRV